MGDVAALITAIGSLATAILWPVSIIVLVMIFRRPISTLLRSDDVSFTAPGGISLSAKRIATNALVDASKSRGPESLSKEQAEAEVDESQRQLRWVRDPVILWVDDVPSNNRYERQVMEALGINFVFSTNTEDGFEKAARHHFDAIISDMSRPLDNEAGYTLLRMLRKEEVEVPLIFYTWNSDPAAYDRAIDSGAAGITNLADELVRIVVGTLRTQRAMRRQ